jgi:hypothetical protein
MHEAETPEMKNIGPLDNNNRFDIVLAALFLIGVVAFVAGLLVDAQRAWYNYLIEFFFFLCIALGGLVFAAVQYAASASWSVTIRRIGEGLFSYLPGLAITVVILLLGVKELYSWAYTAPHDYFTYTKEVYMSTLWFIVREAFFFAIWMIFGFMIVKTSLKQDKTQDPRLTRRNKKLSIIFLILFGYTFTFSSMDLLMSLNDHFYSTIFGVYCFSGLFLSGMSAIAIVVITLKNKGYLKNAVEKKHLHDLGTWMMAFSVFMVYIGFSQYMLIWYANLPHEITYMIPRSKNGWQFLFALLPLLKWILPFLVLMPEKNRSNPKVIFWVAIGVLVGQWLDIYWMVVPSFSESFRMISWMEIGIFLGFFGLYGLVVRRFYKRHSLVSVGDPSLETCLKGRYLHV